ncbi:MAG: hypothetical protein WAS51_14620 [Ilumatobacteraceae bacterium]
MTPAETFAYLCNIDERYRVRRTASWDGAYASFGVGLLVLRYKAETRSGQVDAFIIEAHGKPALAVTEAGSFGFHYNSDLTAARRELVLKPWQPDGEFEFTATGLSLRRLGKPFIRSADPRRPGPSGNGLLVNTDLLAWLPANRYSAPKGINLQGCHMVDNDGNIVTPHGSTLALDACASGYYDTITGILDGVASSLDHLALLSDGKFDLPAIAYSPRRLDATTMQNVLTNSPSTLIGYLDHLYQNVGDASLGDELPSAVRRQLRAHAMAVAMRRAINMLQRGDKEFEVNYATGAAQLVSHTTGARAPAISWHAVDTGKWPPSKPFEWTA